jgi:hypothetical protein
MLSLAQMPSIVASLPSLLRVPLPIFPWIEQNFVQSNNVEEVVLLRAQGGGVKIDFSCTK